MGGGYPRLPPLPENASWGILMGVVCPDPDRPTKGWTPDVWRLRCALWAAANRKAYHTAEARALDGAARWVALSGRHKPASGPWWTKTLALVVAAVDCADDPESRALLAPWTGRVQGTGAVAPNAFRPYGVDDRPGGS